MFSSPFISVHFWAIPCRIQLFWWLHPLAWHSPSDSVFSFLSLSNESNHQLESYIQTRKCDQSEFYEKAVVFWGRFCWEPSWCRVLTQGVELALKRASSDVPWPIATVALLFNYYSNNRAWGFTLLCLSIPMGPYWNDVYLFCHHFYLFFGKEKQSRKKSNRNTSKQEKDQNRNPSPSNNTIPSPINVLI